MTTLSTLPAADVSLLAHALAATARNPMLILDSSLRVLTANKSFYSMFQISSRDTEGRVLFHLGNGQWNIPLLRELLEQILPEKQEVHDFEVDHAFPHIGRRVMILNARTLVQRAGEPPLIFLAIEDVTKRAGEARDLELSRDFAEGIIETLRDPLLILDTQLNVVRANTAFYETFACREEATQKRKIYDLSEGMWDIPELRTLLEKTLLESSTFRDFELEQFFPGIGHRVLVLNGQRVYEKGEKTEKILLVIEDVTERRRQERFIRFQADALNRVNDAVIAIDNVGGVTYWNSRAEKLLNIPEKASEGIRLEDICTRIEGDSPGALFAPSTEDIPWREYRVRLKDSDEEYYLESSATHNFEKNGQIAGRLVVLRDVTAKKKAEIALNRTNQDLELFTAIASHDLKEPLRMVTMYVGKLAKAFRGKLGEDADAYFDFALDGTKRMRSLIDDLLKYAGIQTGAENYKRLSLPRLVGDVLQDLQVAVGETHAVIDVQGLPDVIADEVQMRQVFQNLIGNALKYRSGAPPIITVAAEKRLTEWVISVRDNGTGFDMAHSKRIFLLFQRLQVRTSESGTGLGLTITKKIVEAHGGRIWAESTRGVGSNFFFTLPR